MSSSCLIVCEKDGRWSAALRAALGRRVPRISETRSLTQAAAALAESPCSLLAVEANDANLSSVIDLVARIAIDYPRAKVVALIGPDMAAAEALLRESGAIDVLDSLRHAPRLARLAQRHHALAPSEPLGVRQTAWQRLPWAAHATPGS